MCPDQTGPIQHHKTTPRKKVGGWRREGGISQAVVGLLSLSHVNEYTV